MGAVVSRVFGNPAADAALLDAARRLAVDEMRAALNAGANACCRDDCGRVVAQVVCYSGNNRRLGADCTARCIAALQLLAEHGGLTAETASEALHDAPTADVARMLLNAGAQPDGKWRGTTPLHDAGARNADIARVLAAAGADVNAHHRWGGGWRPLHHAVFVAETDGEALRVIAVLLEAGAAINAVDHAGRTCLFNAVAPCAAERRARRAIVRALLDAGADPTVVSKASDTPLTLAASRCNALISAINRGDAKASELKPFMDVLRLLQRALAWLRRRHLLLAIRGRRTCAAPAACTTADAAHASAGAAPGATSGRSAGSS